MFFVCTGDISLINSKCFYLSSFRATDWAEWEVSIEHVLLLLPYRGGGCFPRLVLGSSGWNGSVSLLSQPSWGTTWVKVSAGDMGKGRATCWIQPSGSLAALRRGREGWLHKLKQSLWFQKIQTFNFLFLKPLNDLRCWFKVLRMFPFISSAYESQNSEFLSESEREVVT